MTQRVPDESTVRAAIKEEAEALKDEAVRLRLEKNLLRSIHLQGRSDSSPTEERIRRAIEDLNKRLANVNGSRDEILKLIDTVWTTKCQELAPGSLILDRVARRFGLRFNKEAGDSERLATEIEANKIPSEIQTLLTSVTG